MIVFLEVIYTLFDLDLLRIDENYIIHLDKSIEYKEYKKLDLKYFRLPKNKKSHPSSEALKKDLKT